MNGVIECRMADRLDLFLDLYEFHKFPQYVFVSEARSQEGLPGSSLGPISEPPGSQGLGVSL